MGKAFAGFIRLLVTLALLGLVGYDTWQIAQLRGEVDRLKRSHLVATAAAAHHAGAATPMRETGAGSEPGGGEGTVATLSSAQTHVEAARAALERKDYPEASRQMTLAAEAAQKATTDIRNGGADRLAAFRRAVSGLQTQVDRMLDQNGSPTPIGGGR